MVYTYSLPARRTRRTCPGGRTFHGSRGCPKDFFVRTARIALEAAATAVEAAAVAEDANGGGSRLKSLKTSRLTTRSQRTILRRRCCCWSRSRMFDWDRWDSESSSSSSSSVVDFSLNLEPRRRRRKFSLKWQECQKFFGGRQENFKTSNFNCDGSRSTPS